MKRWLFDQLLTTTPIGQLRTEVSMIKEKRTKDGVSSLPPLEMRHAFYFYECRGGMRIWPVQSLAVADG